jgi:hypothetical protein
VICQFDRLPSPTLRARLESGRGVMNLPLIVGYDLGTLSGLHKGRCDKTQQWALHSALISALIRGLAVP